MGEFAITVQWTVVDHVHEFQLHSPILLYKSLFATMAGNGQTLTDTQSHKMTEHTIRYYTIAEFLVN